MLLLVVIDEIGLEIVLDEISGAFVFRVEHAKWNDLEDDVQLERGWFDVLVKLIQEVEGKVDCLKGHVDWLIVFEGID